ncbi:FlgO family outer membrane protein [Stieleria sp. TO1_6]|uniref:FlgO family outer membrane protein n=1 Tax=Stieleria tagensis TaxID=2956795 RepID=UPI00209B11DF|nr:FlgO family outer membrane protein [Stieleria tagensis]MCO8121252.1 FlgO family outer membrane protein [Stieleria tagensis]
MSLKTLRLFAFFSVCLFACQPAFSQDDGAPSLMRVDTKSNQVLVGQVIENAADHVRFYDLVSNAEMRINKSDVKQVKDPFSPDDAVRLVGLPRLMAWRIGLLTDRRQKTGKVAKVTNQVVYLTLGKGDGIRKGSVFSVYRNMGEIVDPDTGKVLAIERPKISELETVEVHEAFSKARITSSLEIELQVGDEIELNDEMTVAVCPIQNDDGTLSTAGVTLSEEITTALVQAKIRTVERAKLDDVLSELAAQNTILFESNQASKLGKLAGANYAVVGKIVPRGNSGTAFVRLVDVGSGEIVLAASSFVSLANASPVQSGIVGSRSSASVATAGGVAKLGHSIRLPHFLTTSSRYARTSNEGIRIQGFDEFANDKQGAIRTKDADFVGKDFEFEVTFDFGPTDWHASIGIGFGLADRSYNGLKDCVYLHITPTRKQTGHVAGLVELNRFRLGSEEIGEVVGPGPHAVRIIKQGDAVTFVVDPGGDGPTDDDIHTTISNLRDFAPFLHSKNSPLFFGGGGEYLSVSLK